MKITVRHAIYTSFAVSIMEIISPVLILIFMYYAWFIYNFLRNKVFKFGWSDSRPLKKQILDTTFEREH